MPTRLLLGPILYHRPSTPNSWNFAVRILVRATSFGDATRCAITITEDSAPEFGAIEIPNRAWLHADFFDVDRNDCWVGWEVAVPRGGGERIIGYRVVTDTESIDIDEVAIPRRGSLPRVAFFSCNGAGEERKFHELDDPYRLWRDMAQLHRAGIEFHAGDDPSGFHILLGGGDQLYADKVWEDVPLNEHRRKSKDERIAVVPPPALEAELVRQYMDLYCDRWSHAEVGYMKARVPGLFTWDDHDIFDGWGSHDDELTECKLYETIFRAARRTYDVFQVGGDRTLVHSRGDHSLQAVRIVADDADLGIIMLDTRTDRRRRIMLAEAQWQDLNEWLTEFAGTADVARARHLLIVSAVPVVYLQFYLQGVTAPFGLEDDRRDGWEHRDHRGERKRLLMKLLENAKRAGCQTTILSGDVHVAARGRVVSVARNHLRSGQHESVIHQLTSSAIGHPEPNFWQWLGIQLTTSDDPDQVADGVRSETNSMLPGERFIRSRNFLTLGIDAQHQLWAQWYTEKHGGLDEQVVIAAGRRQ